MHLGCSSIIGRLTDLCTPPPQRLLYKVPDSLSLYRSPYTFYTVNVNNLEVHLTSTLNVCCASGTRQTEYQTVLQHRVTQSNSFHSDFAFQEQFERETFKPPPHPAVTCVPILQQYIQWERERDCVVIVVLSRSSETRLHVSTAFLPAGVPALRPSAENTVWWAGDGHEFASQKTDELMQVCASRCHMLLLWLLCESVRLVMWLPLKLTATVKSFTVGINTSCSRPLRIVHFRNNSSDNNNDSVLRAVPFKGPHSQSHASISPQQHQQTLCPLSLHPSIWF